MANNPLRLTHAVIMALNEEEGIVTRQKRPNYFLLNDGFDDEAAPEDRILDSSQSDFFESFTDIPSSEILPSESASQTPATSSQSSILRHTRKRPRPAPVTNWMWSYFEVTNVTREWVVKRTKRRELIDRDIRCIYVDNQTGIQCLWKTSDSLRQTSTTNMQRHLEKHSIFPPSDTASLKKPQPSIISLITK
jgi:hypothetical protein